jgi:hypothetical protein
MSNSRFGKGTGAYHCEICGRLTRQTGAQSIGSKTCPQCFDLAGIENEITDGYLTLAGAQPQVITLLAEIAEKGGSVSDWEHLKAETE